MFSKCLFFVSYYHHHISFSSFLYTDSKLWVIKTVIFGDKLVRWLQYIQLFPQKGVFIILCLNGHGILDRDLICGILHFLNRRA